MSRFASLASDAKPPAPSWSSTVSKPAATGPKKGTVVNKADAGRWRSVSTRPARAPATQSSKPAASPAVKSLSGLPKLHRGSSEDDMNKFVTAWSMRNRVRPAEPLGYSVGDHVKVYTDFEMGVDSNGNPWPVNMASPMDATVVTVDTHCIYVRVRGQDESTEPVAIQADMIRPLIIDYRERDRVDTPMTLTQLLMLTFVRRENNTLLRFDKWNSDKAIGYANFKCYLADSNVSMFGIKLRMQERHHFDLLRGWGAADPDTKPPASNACIVAQMKCKVDKHHKTNEPTIIYFPGRWAVITELEFSILEMLARVTPGSNVMEDLSPMLHKSQQQLFNRFLDLSKMDDVTSMLPDQVWWRHQYTPPDAVINRQ